MFVFAGLCSRDTTAGWLPRLRTEILEAHTTNVINAYINNSNYVTLLTPTWKQDRIRTASKRRALATPMALATVKGCL